MKEHAGIADFEKFPPSVRFNEFGDSNINFLLWFRVTKATDQFQGEARAHKGSEEAL